MKEKEEKEEEEKLELTVSRRIPILTSWQLALLPLPCSHLAATGRQSTCALLLFTKSLAHICLISHIQALKSRCMFWSRLIRTLSRGGMYLVVHPRWPRVISRAEGNLEVGGDAHCTTQYIPTWGSVWPLFYCSRFVMKYRNTEEYCFTIITFIINPSPGMYQTLHPNRVIGIDSWWCRIHGSFLKHTKEKFIFYLCCLLPATGHNAQRIGGVLECLEINCFSDFCFLLGDLKIRW